MCERFKGQISIFEILDMLEKGETPDLMELATQIIKNGSRNKAAKEEIEAAYRSGTSREEMITIIKRLYAGGVFGFRGYRYSAFFRACKQGIEVAYRTGEVNAMTCVSWELVESIIYGLVKDNKYNV